MTISQQSVDCCQTFAESYELSNLKPMLEIEKRVLGCDYGGTSWTTRAQADQAISLLGLSPDAHLLDIGSGSGWPALYLCGQSGARLTMLDVTVNALQMATERAGRDGLESRVNVIAASADALPFAKGSFDRISHSDVLCCLPEKERMLDECRRVAAPGAQMLFAVIYVAEGLQPAAHQRVVEAGPPFIDAPTDYESMLVRSGWETVRRFDVTDVHRQSLADLVIELDASDALKRAIGEEVVAEAVRQRREQIAVIDEGSMRRESWLVRAQ